MAWRTDKAGNHFQPGSSGIDSDTMNKMSQQDALRASQKPGRFFWNMRPSACMYCGSRDLYYDSSGHNMDGMPQDYHRCSKCYRITTVDNSHTSLERSITEDEYLRQISEQAKNTISVPLFTKLDAEKIIDNRTENEIRYVIRKYGLDAGEMTVAQMLKNVAPSYREKAKLVIQKMADKGELTIMGTGNRAKIRVLGSKF